MVLKKFTGNLGNLGISNILGKRNDDVGADLDTPEANAARGVRLFCESAEPGTQGEEILHLPAIVEAAESSPAAAAAAAAQIRKFLSKDNYSRPHVQYNSVMLIRILADNPGPSFTKNLNDKFCHTVKELLRTGRDPSVQQILRETLTALEAEKAYDTNLNPLFAMWRREVVLATPGASFGPRTLNAPPWNGGQAAQQGSNQNGNFFGRGGGSSSRVKSLPPPPELAARIEEARTTAKLLLQLVQSTPPTELLSNDLVKEFAERCQAASRSLQAYMACDNPAPDDDTMQTLIETTEQLSLAGSKHQRAVLQARRALGTAPGQSPSPPIGPGEHQQHDIIAPTPQPPSSVAATSTYAPPPGPPPNMRASLSSRENGASSNSPPLAQPQPQPQSQPPSQQTFLPPALEYPPLENPFSDHHEEAAHPPTGGGGPPVLPRRAPSKTSTADEYGPSTSPAEYTGPSFGSGPADEGRRDRGGVSPATETGTWGRRRESWGQDEQGVSPVETKAVTYRY
ncbi:hypothetical protein BDY21DRAFT_367992 [Lineolata rhizophorae]|uniref:GAT domain-containing protein n=1 Tax=Lineolata rhizophorae TaxID=578093 RepID=A0A6A6PCX0_9PEZI|nr:hypothetical protein BDY21DRAFT_367992 [Lineolata rhizophorae]